MGAKFGYVSTIDRRMHSLYIWLMKRTTIFLTDDQIKRLAKTSTRKGINTAQLIRIYINAGLNKDKS
jgi:hypothetical protein